MVSGGLPHTQNLDVRRLREETAGMPHGVMQISPEQGQFMALLTELMNVRRAIEVLSKAKRPSWRELWCASTRK